jgi:uroporphyrinogen-III decarboxylase
MNAGDYIQSFHDQLVITKTMDVRREEYLDYVTFKRNDRPLFTEIFGPLLGLKEEWAAQGATPEELDMSAFRYRRPLWAGVPVKTGWIGDLETVILEETEDLLIARDFMGRRVQLAKKAATLPLPMENPVSNMDDWLAIKHHYEFSEQRFAPEWAARARQLQREGYIVSVSIPGGYDEPRQLMGDEGLLMAYYDQPEVIHDMLATMGDTAFRVLDRVSSTIDVDELNVHEDMAGISGPLVGPRQVTEFIKPYYRRIWDMLESRGARVFRQDSDGDMRPLMSQFIDAGLNLMYPIEPTAGMDLVALREAYGTQMAFMGGLDKHVIRRAKEEIVAELEYKIPPMVQSGGCILALDHRIPNGTPLENYRFYIDKAWEILDREAAKL